jgi:hypothetical protein
MLLARDERTIDRLEQKILDRIRYANVRENAFLIQRPLERALVAGPLWTDDFSNILGVVKIKR